MLKGYLKKTCFLVLAWETYVLKQCCTITGFIALVGFFHFNICNTAMWSCLSFWKFSGSGVFVPLISLESSAVWLIFHVQRDSLSTLWIHTAGGTLHDDNGTETECSYTSYQTQSMSWHTPKNEMEGLYRTCAVYSVCPYLIFSGSIVRECYFLCVKWLPVNWSLNNKVIKHSCCYIRMSILMFHKKSY